METQIIINDYANRSLRDLADQDYIAARICHRCELDQLFLWNSLQAIEKYLKAILLYNQRSAKGLGHDLRTALRRVRLITDIPFDLPDDVVKFIEYIDDYGANRYLDYPTYIRDRSLLFLDRTILHIRRYCYYLRGEIVKQDGARVSTLDLELERIHQRVFKQYPNRFRIEGGFLERIMEKNCQASSLLIWKNFYFGKIRKRKIKKVTIRVSASNPTHFMHPEVISELDKLVDFPKALRKHFRSTGKLTAG